MTWITRLSSCLPGGARSMLKIGLLPAAAGLSVIVGGRVAAGVLRIALRGAPESRTRANWDGCRVRSGKSVPETILSTPRRRTAKVHWSRD